MFEPLLLSDRSSAVGADAAGAGSGVVCEADPETAVLCLAQLQPGRHQDIPPQGAGQSCFWFVVPNWVNHENHERMNVLSVWTQRFGHMVTWWGQDEVGRSQRGPHHGFSAASISLAQVVQILEIRLKKAVRPRLPLNQVWPHRLFNPVCAPETAGDHL